MRQPEHWDHSSFSRREALQVGAVGILGLGVNHLAGLREAHAATGSKPVAEGEVLHFHFSLRGISAAREL